MKSRIYKKYTIDQLYYKLNEDNFAEKEFYKRYKLLVRKFVSKYKLGREEREDLIQEGMIGLFNAIKSYDPNKNTKFSTYAKTCIENNIKNSLNSIYRQKMKFVNDIELDDITIKNTPEKDAIIDDYTNKLQEYIKNFKDLEVEVLKKYFEGNSYFQIANLLNVSEKKVDNILQKIRKNLEKYINENESIKTIDSELLMNKLKKILLK